MVKRTVKERRRWIRAKRVLSITFQLKQGVYGPVTGQKAFLSTTEDMSVGGLTFYTDCEYHIGDILDLKVVMSGILDIYDGYGEVVRVQRKKSAAHYLVAVKYVKLSTSIKARSVKKKTRKRI